jgi:hypothetical protein
MGASPPLVPAHCAVLKNPPKRRSAAAVMNDELASGIERAVFGAIGRDNIDGWLSRHLRTGLGGDLYPIFLPLRTNRRGLRRRSQRRLADAGYPCPAPVDGPATTDGLMAVIETLPISAGHFTMDDLPLIQPVFPAVERHILEGARVSDAAEPALSFYARTASTRCLTYHQTLATVHAYWRPCPIRSKRSSRGRGFQRSQERRLLVATADPCVP